MKKLEGPSFGPHSGGKPRQLTFHSADDNVVNWTPDGKNIIFTPGVYNVGKSIRIQQADTVVLGLGLATLTAAKGAIPITVGNVPGVDIAGLIIDAGSTNSPARPLSCPMDSARQRALTS